MDTHREDYSKQFNDQQRHTNEMERDANGETTKGRNEAERSIYHLDATF